MLPVKTIMKFWLVVIDAISFCFGPDGINKFEELLDKIIYEKGYFRFLCIESILLSTHTICYIIRLYIF